MFKIFIRGSLILGAMLLFAAALFLVVFLTAWCLVNYPIPTVCMYLLLCIFVLGADDE